MVTKLRILSASAAICMSALIALVTGAGPKTAVAATQVPFTAEYSGAMYLTNGGFPVSVKGSGKASHLGASANQGTVTLLDEQNSNCPATGFVVLNHQTLTSIQDNDDTIDITISDHPCPVTNEPGFYSGSDRYVVTGGTGRFTHASGQGTFVGSGDFNNDTFVYTFNGTISPPDDNY